MDQCSSSTMQDCKIEFIGDPCGQHGPYTFYRSVKYWRDDDKWKTLCLGEFFHARISSSGANSAGRQQLPISMVSELQALWQDKNHNGIKLASVRLYFLPEDSKQGRCDQNHGQDEVLVEEEKFVIKIEDLLTWVTDDPIKWEKGLLPPTTLCRCAGGDTEVERTTSESRPLVDVLPHQNGHVGRSNLRDLNMKYCTGSDKDIRQGRCTHSNPPYTVVLTFPQYCRYKAMLKRLEYCTDRRLAASLLTTASSLPISRLQESRVMFCRDTAENRLLEQHSYRLNNLAPVLKGRKRKRKMPNKNQESDDSAESETNSEKNHATERNCKRIKTVEKPNRKTKVAAVSLDEDHFLKRLYKYMKDRNTPIGRIPILGFKEVNLYQFYKCAQKFGGYRKVTEKDLWKQVYTDLGGCESNTRSASGTRRNYEKYLLPYENHMTSSNAKKQSNDKSKGNHKFSERSKYDEASILGKRSIEAGKGNSKIDNKVDHPRVNGIHSPSKAVKVIARRNDNSSRNLKLSADIGSRPSDVRQDTCSINESPAKLCKIKPGEKKLETEPKLKIKISSGVGSIIKSEPDVKSADIDDLKTGLKCSSTETKIEGDVSVNKVKVESHIECDNKKEPCDKPTETFSDNVSDKTSSRSRLLDGPLTSIKPQNILATEQYSSGQFTSASSFDARNNSGINRLEALESVLKKDNSPHGVVVSNSSSFSSVTSRKFLSGSRMLVDRCSPSGKPKDAACLEFPSTSSQSASYSSSVIEHGRGHRSVHVNQPAKNTDVSTKPASDLRAEQSRFTSSSSLLACAGSSQRNTMLRTSNSDRLSADINLRGGNSHRSRPSSSNGNEDFTLPSTQYNERACSSNGVEDEPTDLSRKTLKHKEQRERLEREAAIRASLLQQDEPLNLSTKSVRQNSAATFSSTGAGFEPQSRTALSMASHLGPQLSLDAMTNSGLSLAGLPSAYPVPSYTPAQLAQFLPMAALMPQFHTTYSSAFPMYPTAQHLLSSAMPQPEDILSLLGTAHLSSVEQQNFLRNLLPLSNAGYKN